MSIRIGFYICHCGINIASKVRVTEVAEYVAAFPGVEISKEYLFMCSDPGQELIEKDIRRNDNPAAVSEHLDARTILDDSNVESIVPWSQRRHEPARKGMVSNALTDSPAIYDELCLVEIYADEQALRARIAEAYAESSRPLVPADFEIQFDRI